MADDKRVLLTVLLHHDQSKTLDEIMAHLRKTGFYRDFPPEGSELVSWVVAMSYARCGRSACAYRSLSCPVCNAIKSPKSWSRSAQPSSTKTR